MTNTERQRIAAILGMLGSSHVGERDAAALQAEAFRRKHGLTWAEMINGKTIFVSREVFVDRPAPPPPPPPQQPKWTAEEQNEWLNHSEWVLRQKVGDKKVDDAIAYFQAASVRDPSLSQRLYEQADPYGWVLAQMEEAQRPQRDNRPCNSADIAWVAGVYATPILLLWGYFHWLH